MKCKDCKYWQLEDELPGITAFMECTRVDENDPDWWKKWHWRGTEDSCEHGERKRNMVAEYHVGDSLISRKAAIEEFEDMATSVSVYGESAEARYATNARIRFIEKLNSIPTIPAVPIEPLCRYLEVYARTPIYNLRHTAEWWKEELNRQKWEKWVVKQHE